MISDVLNSLSNDYWFKENSYDSGEILIKELSKCSPSLVLIKEAQRVIQEQGLSVLEIRLEQTNCLFRAKTQGSIITINPNLPPSEQRYLAIFELTNIIQHAEHVKALHASLTSVSKSSEEYVRAVEFIEYKGNIRAKAVAQAINKEKGCFFKSYIKTPWEYIPIERLGFKLYYSLFIDNHHKEHHRNNWRHANQTFNISTYDDSCNLSDSNACFKRALRVSFVGCIAIAFTISFLVNFYRLLNEFMK